MLGRATWLGVGLVAGFGASKWVERKVRRRLRRYLPAGSLPMKVSTEVAGKARELAAGKLADVRGAVKQGRAGMVEKEAELRGQLQAWSRPAGGAGAGAATVAGLASEAPWRTGRTLRRRHATEALVIGGAGRYL